MPTNNLMYSRETIAFFDNVLSAKQSFIKSLGKDAKMEDPAQGFDFSKLGLTSEIQSTTFAAAFEKGELKAFEGSTNQDVVDHYNAILKQNPAPFFTAPLTNTAVYKALAVAAFVTLSVMTSGIAGALGTALYTTGLAGATYLGFQLGKSHWNAHSAIMSDWNAAQDKLGDKEKAGFLGKTGQFLKSLFITAGRDAFNNQQIVYKDDIKGDTKFLDKLKGLTLSSEGEANQWTIRNHIAPASGMALTAIAAFYFSPALMLSIASAIVLTGVLPTVANAFKFFEKSETPEVTAASGKPAAAMALTLPVGFDKSGLSAANTAKLDAILAKDVKDLTQGDRDNFASLTA